MHGSVLSFDEATSRILALASPPLAEETVPLDEAEALVGRVLADDLVAATDVPTFDASTMDGYALSTRDVEGGPPYRLRVDGESRAGGLARELALREGSAMRTFTGARMPEGANAVIMQEHVTRDGDRITFTEEPPAGQFVRRRGDDLRQGEIALEQGTRLRASHLALAASLDLASVRLRKRPRLVFFATGDELRKPGTPGPLGSVPESNTTALRAMACRAGAKASATVLVEDDRATTEAALDAALNESDLLVTVGGVSVGDHDLVRPALEAIGVNLDFWRVAMKPGKPVCVGTRRSETKTISRVLCLPGNPASALVTFGLFGIPLLRAMQGDREPLPRRQRAVLSRRVAHAPGRLEFARVRLRYTQDGELSAEPLLNQASGATLSMAHANALALLPAEAHDLTEGTRVEVIAFDELLL
jgi:molybdopterin molybdotransferase